jgi:hypothetical protein
MRNRMAAGVITFAALVVAGATAGETLKSGPQKGENLAGPFHPLNATGKMEGKKHCLVWQNGGNPVAMIFAREVSDNLTSLVKKIDAETAKNKGAKMGSFVVFLSEDEKLQDKLKELATKEGITNTIFAIDNPAGPKGYEVAKDSDITVVLYVKQKVQANHTFKKGQLNDKAIDAIVADVPKILPESKK